MTAAGVDSDATAGRTVRANYRDAAGRSYARRPTRLASGVALLVAVLGVALLEPTARVRVLLVGQLLGVGIAAAGVGRWGRSGPGRVVGLAGGLLVVAAPAALVGWVAAPDAVVTALPGLIGVACLAGALLPLRGDGSRGLLKLGTGLVFLAALVAGIIGNVALQTLLLGGTAAVVAWDAGDHAIALGEQVGRSATTRRAEVGHLAGTTLVGAVAVLVGQFLPTVGRPGIPLAALGALLFAAVLLALALHE